MRRDTDATTPILDAIPMNVMDDCMAVAALTDPVAW